VELRVATGDEESQRRATFEVERAGLLADRTALMAGFFLVSIGLSVLATRVFNPERMITGMMSPKVSPRNACSASVCARFTPKLAGLTMA